MVSQSFQLVMKAGPTPGKAYALDKGEIKVGRDISNDIIINDAEVSRKHARITIQGDSYVLEDLGSTNGTFVDGERLTGPHILGLGQTISLGENVTLDFEAVQFDPDVTLVSAPEEIAEGPVEAVPPPPQEDYTPVPGTYTPSPPPPEPVYAGQVPSDQPEPLPAPGRRTSTWLIGGCGCLIIILCIVIVASVWYIDTNYLWCDVFPFIPGCQ